MNSPKISIIVPVYNAVKSLRRCVDSILKQKYSDFELLLVNDGSTDGSRDICDEYATTDNRVRTLHKPNGGVSDARNLGLSESQGEWITFCDADDYLFPKWSDIMQEDCWDADIVIFGMNIQKENSIQEISYSFEGSPLEWLELEQSHTLQGVLWNKIFHAKLIKKLPLKTDVRFDFKEDEEFVMRCLTYANRVRCIDVIAYNYFEPDWSKYFTASKSLSIFWLVASLQNSFNKLGINTLSNSNIKELRYRMMYNSFHDPLHTLTYLRTYLRLYMQHKFKR